MHRFVDNDELVWYRGTVIKMLETKEYEVQYNEEEDIFTNLLYWMTLKMETCFWSAN